MTNEAINNLLGDVLACVCTALESGVCLDGEGSQCGCPCRSFISAGPVVWDQAACCSDGQLTAHVDRVFMYDRFPSPSGQPSVCSNELAAEVVVTLLRCWPAVLHEDGSAPTKDEIQAAAEALNKDLVLISKATVCCLGKNKARPFVFQGARIVGPDGGCAGIEARFVIAVS